MHFSILSCSIILSLSLTDVNSEIKLVNVLFRHGDRAPGNFIKTCPNDPSTNNTFYPMGLGGLTNEGKLRLYNLGKLLRTTYDDFLGTVYMINHVEAISSNSARARMSLQMALAGLYPPSPIQQWDSSAKWQPVLISYMPTLQDTIFVPQLCEEYQKEYERIINSKEFQLQVRELEPFMKDLAKHMGRNSPITTLDMNHLYHTFVAERSMNLPLPHWAKDMFPQGNLRKGALLQYLLYGYSEKLRRLAGGVILKKIINDMKNVENSDYKIHLYSGHELNIVMLLQTLGLYNDHIPEYSSAIIIELHKIRKQYYIKVFYYKGIPAEVEIQKIPGCDELCPFDTFVNLLANVIPTKEELKCKRLQKPRK